MENSIAQLNADVSARALFCPTVILPTRSRLLPSVCTCADIISKLLQLININKYKKIKCIYTLNKMAAQHTYMGLEMSYTGVLQGFGHKVTDTSSK